MKTRTRKVWLIKANGMRISIPFEEVQVGNQLQLRYLVTFPMEAGDVLTSEMEQK